VVSREENIQGVEKEVQGGACADADESTHKNGRDAKSFVGEDDGVVGVAERSSEIDAVVPRAHLYHAGDTPLSFTHLYCASDTPVLLRYKLHLYCITQHSTMMMMLLMMMTMTTITTMTVIILLHPQ